MVRLIEAERRECAKTQALSSQIDAEYQGQAALKSQAPVRTAEPALAASDSAIDAYQLHYRDVLKRQRGKVNLSRVDSMIAVRMRVTGHNQTAIKGALRQCAPGIRQNAEHRDWKRLRAAHRPLCLQRRRRPASRRTGEVPATMGEAGKPRTDPTNQPSGGQL